MIRFVVEKTGYENVFEIDKKNKKEQMKSNSSNGQKCDFCDISIESRLSLIQQIKESHMLLVVVKFKYKPVYGPYDLL